MRESYPSYFPLQNSATQQRLLRAMHDNTQASLRDAGIGETIRLRRGMTITPARAESWRQDAGASSIKSLEGAKVSYSGSVMESWSVSSGTASDFASSWGREVGIMIEMDIPITRLLSSPRTGFGCLEEFEFVHVGAFNDEVARIIKVDSNL